MLIIDPDDLVPFTSILYTLSFKYNLRRSGFRPAMTRRIRIYSCSLTRTWIGQRPVRTIRHIKLPMHKIGTYSCFTNSTTASVVVKSRNTLSPIYQKHMLSKAQYNQLITWNERQTSKGKVRTWRNFKLVRLTNIFCFSKDSVVVGDEYN